MWSVPLRRASNSVALKRILPSRPQEWYEAVITLHVQGIDLRKLARATRVRAPKACKNQTVDGLSEPDTVGAGARAVVLVEGASDRAAVETLAMRLGRNLEAERVSVVSMGGAHAIGRFLTRYGPKGLNVRLAGLYDVGEERVVRRNLERAGFGSAPQLTRVDMEGVGFYVCVIDLEDELIRACGAASVESLLDSEGDLDSFRTLQKEPAWRGQAVEAQLRRFMGSGSRRKLRYARLLVESLELTAVPRPLHNVLARI